MVTLEPTAEPTAPATLVLVTTADTDILTAERALVGMPWGDAVRVYACNPVALEGEDESAESARTELMDAVGQASAVVLRLLGGKRALGQVFDPLVEICRANRTPLIACPGHQEWDEDLITACTAPVAEVESVFAYLMRGGVLNFRNLFLFLADTYLDGEYGHEAPAPMPWQGVYHPEVARRHLSGRLHGAALCGRAAISGGAVLPRPLDERQPRLHRHADPTPGSAAGQRAAGFLIQPEAHPGRRRFGAGPNADRIYGRRRRRPQGRLHRQHHGFGP